MSFFMKNGETVRNWRKSLGYSQRELAEMLNSKINADIPADDPHHYVIHQPDLNKVESGRASKLIFYKIVNAIYKYTDVEEGYFGEYQEIVPETTGDEQASPYVYLHEGIKLRDRIIELMEEKELLMARVSELEMTVETLQKQVKNLGGDIN